MLAAATATAVICVATSEPARERVDLRISWGQMNRSAIVYLPEDWSPQAQWPLVIALHPEVISGEDRLATSQLPFQPGVENVVVLASGGFRRGWKAGDCCGRAEARTIDDAGFPMQPID